MHRRLTLALALLISLTALLIQTSTTLAAPSVVATIPLGPGPSPRMVAVNPTTNQVYVTTASGITVINGATSFPTATIPMASPFDVAVNPATNLIYATNRGANNVAVINGTTNKL